MQLNDKEVMELLLGDSSLNRARQVFSSYSAMIEQSYSTPIEIRRLEFEAVLKIKEILDDQ